MSVYRSYARALFESAVLEKNAPDEIEKHLGLFLAAAQSTRESQTALFSPVTSVKEKHLFIEAISKKLGTPDLIVRFLKLLADRGRLRWLSEISETFGSVRLMAEGGVMGEMVVAENVDQKDLEGLASAFSRKLGKKVKFKTVVDPSLLAGMKVTVNGVTYDGSLRSQLERLRDLLVGQRAT